MNIVITLPIDLIAQIANGRKQVEIRKRIPKKFNPNEDIVWVKVKGHNRIPMCIVISHFLQYDDKMKVWNIYGNQIGIPYVWYDKYVKDDEKIAVWFIRSAHVFIPNLSFKKEFPNITPPQSYCYTKKKLCEIMATTTLRDIFINDEESSEST